jgi:hypothetical protein
MRERSKSQKISREVPLIYDMCECQNIVVSATIFATQFPISKLHIGSVHQSQSVSSSSKTTDSTGSAMKPGFFALCQSET